MSVFVGEIVILLQFTPTKFVIYSQCFFFILSKEYSSVGLLLVSECVPKRVICFTHVFVFVLNLVWFY